ncbi:MAG: hypothetical protein KTR14_00310 [Vampirovibrio sp.]|nr:hypothetical protein [Vampirovibrio sp.]
MSANMQGFLAGLNQTMSGVSNTLYGGYNPQQQSINPFQMFVGQYTAPNPYGMPPQQQNPMMQMMNMMFQVMQQMMSQMGMGQPPVPPYNPPAPPNPSPNPQPAPYPIAVNSGLQSKGVFDAQTPLQQLRLINELIQDPSTDPSLKQVYIKLAENLEKVAELSGNTQLIEASDVIELAKKDGISYTVSDHDFYGLDGGPTPAPNPEAPSSTAEINTLLQSKGVFDAGTPLQQFRILNNLQSDPTVSAEAKATIKLLADNLESITALSGDAATLQSTDIAELAKGDGNAADVSQADVDSLDDPDTAFALDDMKGFLQELGIFDETSADKEIETLREAANDPAKTDKERAMAQFALDHYTDIAQADGITGGLDAEISEADIEKFANREVEISKADADPTKYAYTRAQVNEALTQMGIFDAGDADAQKAALEDYINDPNSDPRFVSVAEVVFGMFDSIANLKGDNTVLESEDINAFARLGGNKGKNWFTHRDAAKLN